MYKIITKRHLNEFLYNFDENNTLIVKSSSRIAVLEDNKNLDNLYFNKIEKIFSYELIFETRIDLDDVKQDIEKLDEIIDFQIKYGN